MSKKQSTSDQFRKVSLEGWYVKCTGKYHLLQSLGAHCPHLVVLRSGIQQAVMDDRRHPLQHSQNQVRRDAESHPLGTRTIRTQLEFKRHFIY